MESEKTKRNSHKNEFVKLTNLETNEVKFFKNGMEVAREIGCPHTLVYKALRGEGDEDGNWRVEYISKDDPQCADFKKALEDRMCDLRQKLVEYTRDQILKRKEFVKEEKARRKKEHDEFVRTARGMVSCAL